MCVSRGYVNFPHLEELAREYFPTYILYHRDSRSSKMCYCTRCGSWFGADKATDVYGEDEIYRSKHGAHVNCPCCDYPATLLAGGRMSTFSSLRQTERLVYIEVEGFNRVVLRAYYVTVDYGDMYSDSPSPVFGYDLKAKYVLTPGEVHCFFNNKHYTEDESDMREVSIREPFAGFMYNPGSYAIMNIDALQDSFLKFHNAGLFADVCRPYCVGNDFAAPRVVRNVSYLCYYAKYPQIEFLLNEEAYQWVGELVYHKKHNRRYLNWSERSQSKFFRMTKPEARMFSEMGFDKSILKLWYDNKKEMDFAELIEQARYFGRSTFLEFYRFCKDKGIDRAEAIAYFEREKGVVGRAVDVFRIWKDYIKAALYLGYDLTVHNVLFPRDLIEYHDNAVASQTVAGVGKLNKAQITALKARAKRYEYEDDRFEIVFPMSVEEIVAEGRMQSNCVAGYAERHIKGTLDILFLREKDKPDTSFFTLEVRDGRIQQCLGYKNEVYRDLTASQKELAQQFLARDRTGAMRFKDEWWAWVLAGSPRAKNGKPLKLAEKKKVRKEAV